MNLRRSSDQSGSNACRRPWQRYVVVVLIGICVMPSQADDPAADNQQPDPVSLSESAPAKQDSNPEPESSSGGESDAVLPLWQLDVGQVFRTDVYVERQTEFQVADEVDVSSQTDHHGFRYRVLANDPRGGVQLQMQVETLNRTATTTDGDVSTVQKQPQQVLDSHEIDLRLRDGGRQIDSAGLQALIRSRQPETREIFSRFVGPQVFHSWIDLPFRIPLITQIRSGPDIRIQPRRSPAPPGQPEPSATGATELSAGLTWNRIHTLSLGLLGIVEIDCLYTVNSIDASVAKITVSGAARAESTQSPSRSALTLVSVDVSDSEIQGTGRVEMNSELQYPTAISFEQQLTLKGSGVLRSGDQTHEFRFKQLLTQKWNVSEFGYHDTPQGVPLQPIRSNQ